MSTPESYEKYKVVSKKNAEKAVKLGMAFRDISEKEKIAVLPAEIQEQWDMIAVQAKQKGEKVPDERRAKDEIENQLLRKKVFDLVAANAKIEWKEMDPIAT
jgi:FKBP-type peptidyl-prolyl cis-trans isomerase (trigger factor)